MPNSPHSKDFRSPAWIRPTDQVQSQWLLEYFRKKGVPLESAGFGHHQQNLSIESVLSSLPDDKASYELLLKAKGAWRQKQQRQQRKGFKAYSFLLPIEIHGALKKLAGVRRISMTEAVEQAINETFEESRQHDENLKNLKKSHNQEITKIKENSKILIGKNQKRVTTQKKFIGILIEELKDALTKIEEAEFRKSENIATQLTKTDTNEISKKVETKLKEIKGRLGISQLLNMDSPMDR